MDFETLTIYKSWNLKRPKIPPRSRLYQLEPIGIGTPFVESLTSFVARLAQAHCVLPRILISRELTPLLPKIYRTRNLFGIRDWTGALNSTGTMALDLVMVLEALTLGSDLRFLTLLTWANVLPQRKLLRSYRAWCPTCYEKWRLTKQVIYEPLMWSIDAVNVCPPHKRRLSFQCPYCSQLLPLLTPYSRPGYCSKCGEWLGISADSEISDSETLGDEELMWQTWVVDAVGELLAIAPSLVSPPPKQRVVQGFCGYIERAAEGNIAAFARILQIPKNKVWMWQSGKVLPQLNVILKVCYCLRTSVLDFLTLEAAVENFSQITPLVPKEAADKPRKAPEKIFDLHQVQRGLESLLQGDEKPPPPMTEVARRLGHDKRIIHRHFPNLCRAISAQYVEYKSQARLTRITQCCEKVQQAVKKLHAEGVYPTEARVSKFLDQPGCCRDKEVRAALREARRELGL